MDQNISTAGRDFVVAGSTAFSSAMCYAAIAFDSASDPAYADGWQDGDNGGSGFTAWNFDARINSFAQYTTPGFKAIDDGLQSGTPFSSTFNNIGRAWTIGATPNDDGGNHVGRGFAWGLARLSRLSSTIQQRGSSSKGISSA